MNLCISYPTLDQIKSALFIQPHPDDNEIGAGGTIALLRSKGVLVYGLTVTLGEGGSSDPNITSEQIVQLRKREAEEAMKTLDMIDLGNLGYRELSTLTHRSLVEDIVKVLRDLKVDAVFSVDPQLINELHPTHIQTGLAVSEAFMRCGVLRFPADGMVHETAYTPMMIGYYLTNHATTVVKIDSFIEKKVEAVKVHKSQVSPMLIEAIYATAEANAIGYSFQYAEGLKLCGPLQSHCYAIPESLLKMESRSVYE